MNRLVFPVLGLLLLACGEKKAPEAPVGASTAPVTAPTGVRPSCDAIDEACDPHEDEGGLAKECHDLAESKATTEAACASRKVECLAACPAKKK